MIDDTKDVEMKEASGTKEEVKAPVVNPVYGGK